MNRALFGTSLASWAALAVTPFAGVTAKESRMSFPAMNALLTDRERVHEIAIYHVSQTIQTRTAILPEKIESFPGVEKHVVTDAATIDAVFSHLRKADAVPASRITEYRWKLAFASTTGAAIAILYLSGIAPSGMLGEQPFAVANLDLANWLRAKFSPEDEEFFKKYGS